MGQGIRGVTVSEHEDVHRIWEEQLGDYRAILRLAESETRNLAGERFEILLDSHTQRQCLAQRILERDLFIRTYGDALQIIPQEVLEEITVTIEAVQMLDSRNKQRLEAEHEAVADLVQKLKKERIALHQYKPCNERLPQFLNRTV
jgi:hypothetical protein